LLPFLSVSDYPENVHVERLIQGVMHWGIKQVPAADMGTTKTGKIPT